MASMTSDGVKRKVIKRRTVGDKEKSTEIYKCVRCGVPYRTQKQHFHATQSTLFNANNGVLPICKQCVVDLYEHYRTILGDPREAVKRVCLKLDIYWSPDVYASVEKTGSANSNRMSTYISRSFLFRYQGKTYDDTLAEAGTVQCTPTAGVAGEVSPDPDSEVDLTVPIASPAPITTPTADTVLFWGAGFTPAFYHELNMRYDRWTRDLPKPLGRAEESLYKQICFQESSINKNIAAGKPIEQGQNALNALLGSLNAKPIQKKEENPAAQEVDNSPLGVWIRRWEDKRPVPDYPEDDMKGGKKLIHYITVWLYGHLGKSLGIRNTYSQAYEDEIEKYRVQKPEFVDEDDDVIISSLADEDGGASDQK